MKKRLYECLLCDWNGEKPLEVESMEPGYEGTFKVCPECSKNKDIPTETLILYLNILVFDE